MKAIVTGANGFIGSYLVNKLVSEGIEVLAISRKFNNNIMIQSDKLTKVYMDVKDIHAIESSINFGEYDLFYHLAWAGVSGESRLDETIQTENALNTLECLKVASLVGCKKFIVAGSIMEYEVNEVTYAQETKPSLSYIYGAGKVLAHELCKPIANMLGIDLIWGYVTNTYGVGENSSRFINTTLRKIINKEKLEFTSGIQNYDFIYIDDVASAFYLLGMFGKANKGYMIGSGYARPLKEFILEICNEYSGDNKPLFGNVMFTGVNLSLEVYSTKEIEKDCGFKPIVSFKEGIRKTYEYLKGN